ncbi:uncharacterized protein ACOB6Z_010545 [Ctenodactylus gundi]
MLPSDRNRSGATFALLGFSDYPDLQVPLFLIFLAIYGVTVVGNIGMILIIRINPKLHTPMYFFLSHLSFVDFCYSSIVAPKMLVNLVVADRSISFSGCVVQFFFFCTFVVTESFVLAVMAYDRFVAICNPLLYTVAMSQRLCALLVAGSYTWGVVCSLTLTCSALWLSFHGFNTINHFFCEFSSLLSLSRSDTYINHLLLFIFATFNEVSTLFIILLSYVLIVVTLLKMRSASGRRKAFSTCASHLTAITIFHGTILFLYCVPNSKNSRHTVKVASVFYTVVIPMLNPLIYSMRNTDVKDTVRKVMGTKVFSVLMSHRDQKLLQMFKKNGPKRHPTNIKPERLSTTLSTEAEEAHITPSAVMGYLPGSTGSSESLSCHSCLCHKGNQGEEQDRAQIVLNHVMMEKVSSSNNRSSGHVDKHNCTAVTEFLLLGLSEAPELRAALFLLFLLVYGVTVAGNLGMTVLIQASSQLHTPMYFFLSHLSWVDFCYSSVIVPNMLANIISEDKAISFPACVIQFCLFCTCVVTEVFLLAVMAYDRFVAICNPLLYTVIMSQKLCAQLVSVCYLGACACSLIHVCLALQIPSYKSDVIDHFFCDLPPLLGPACSDVAISELLLFVVVNFNEVSTVVVILTSHSLILSTVLRTRSAERRCKAFSTCASHLTAIVVFHGTILFIYCQPSSGNSPVVNKATTVFHTVLIPMLNPLIYSLRNKDVKEALRKVLASKMFSRRILY